MPTDDPQAWNLHYREMTNQLAALTSRAQLLQRRLLRADGLTSLERNLLLSETAAILLGVQALGSQARGWAGEEGPPDSSSLA